MIAEKLELTNFRNYKELTLELSENVNILYGNNAQGKTNVLEAIYLCATTKSHKGSKDKDMVKIGEEESHLRMYIQKSGFNHKIDMQLRKAAKKSIAIDGIGIKRAADLYGLANVILFSPEDLSMIKNGPAERRRFMDAELCQLNKLYLQYLSKYNKLLEQRNDLLKQISYRPELKDTLEIWDEQLTECGRFIISERKNFIDDINGIVNEIHNKISGGCEDLKVVYEPNVEAENFKKALSDSLNRDLYQKTTGTGPHRDDISFYTGEQNLKLFGSQGQQRTAALSLKLAEIELVKRKIGENPILLLDDVLSELDRNRQQALLNFIDGIQTVITCTGLEEFVGYRSGLNTLYKVTNGIIERI
ncbi:MAG: DNA replication/repair protein RecF [Lachnospiraceae bacterium]|nr:DNA replication/repair protein RecF [Lachnospiraceae bacterium]